jgi:hypothetical protein
MYVDAKELTIDVADGITQLLPHSPTGRRRGLRIEASDPCNLYIKNPAAATTQVTLMGAGPTGAVTSGDANNGAPINEILIEATKNGTVVWVQWLDG